MKSCATCTYQDIEDQADCPKWHERQIKTEGDCPGWSPVDPQRVITVRLPEFPA